MANKTCIYIFITIFAVLAAGIMGTVLSMVGSTENYSWPLTDSEGYVQSLKSNGRWINGWSVDKPGTSGILKFLIYEKDNSGLVQDELEVNLPIRKPYWIDQPEKFGTKNDGIRVTWLGHATVLAEIEGDISVLTDPIFSQRASAFQFVGPKRYRPPPCTVKELPSKIDVVVISHTHYDHLDYNSVYSIGTKYGSNITWCVPAGLKSWMLDYVPNTSESNVHEMKWWEEIKVFNSTVVFTPSNHWSRRGLTDNNKALWGSWTVRGPSQNFFFGGDTAYQSDIFKQIKKKFGPMDVSAIPIGAYEPRWMMKFVHVNPEEALAIHRDLESKTSLGIHWGTFKLTYEPYMEPKEKIQALVNSTEENFKTVDIGNFIEGK